MNDTVTFKGVNPDEIDWPVSGHEGYIYIGMEHGENFGTYHFDIWDMDITFRRKETLKVGDRFSDNGSTGTVIGIHKAAKDEDSKGVVVQWKDSSFGLYSKREIRRMVQDA